jgi:hypothetical protein
VSIDFFKSLNVVVLNKSTELGEGSPFLVVSSSSGGTAVLAATATTATATTATTTITETSSLSATSFAFHLSI